MGRQDDVAKLIHLNCRVRRPRRTAQNRCYFRLPCVKGAPPSGGEGLFFGCYFTFTTAGVNPRPTPHPPQTQRLRSPCLAAARSRRGSDCHRQSFTTASPLRYPRGRLTTFRISLVGDGFPLPYKTDVTLHTNGRAMVAPTKAFQSTL